MVLGVPAGAADPLPMGETGDTGMTPVPLGSGAVEL